MARKPNKNHGVCKLRFPGSQEHQAPVVQRVDNAIQRIA